jgi:hypothetical protein
VNVKSVIAAAMLGLATLTIAGVAYAQAEDCCCCADRADCDCCDHGEHDEAQPDTQQ